MIHGRNDLHTDERDPAIVPYLGRDKGFSRMLAQGLILKLLEATHGQWIYSRGQIDFFNSWILNSHQKKKVFVGQNTKGVCYMAPI
jgi:hypothetical protein